LRGSILGAQFGGEFANPFAVNNPVCAFFEVFAGEVDGQLRWARQ